MARRKTHQEYLENVKQINSNIRVIGKYNGNKVKIQHLCLICGHKWDVSPNNVLRHKGCPECAKIRTPILRTKTHEEYVEQLKNNNIDIIPIELYKGQKRKIKHKCLKCGYEWETTPGQLLYANGKGCPICSHRAIGPAPEYKNSIWTSEYREYFSMYLTEKQMKIYMPHSQQYVNIVCPNCGLKKKIQIAYMTERGFSCICGDGQSFPNKLVFNILTQLGLNVQPEYSPKWANGKRYDDYLIDYNIIIENHGMQHYQDVPWLSINRTFKEVKDCDEYKYKIAMDNGVKQYIVLDCRVSSVEWIKQSIMKSDLPSIFNFTSDDIDWVKALKYASSNLVKEAVDLFNNGLTVSKIAPLLHRNESTIRIWLRRASKIGWCNYAS